MILQGHAEIHRPPLNGGFSGHERSLTTCGNMKKKDTGGDRKTQRDAQEAPAIQFPSPGARQVTEKALKTTPPQALIAYNLTGAVKQGLPSAQMPGQNEWLLLFRPLCWSGLLLRHRYLKHQVRHQQRASRRINPAGSQFEMFAEGPAVVMCSSHTCMDAVGSMWAGVILRWTCIPRTWSSLKSEVPHHVGPEALPVTWGLRCLSIWNEEPSRQALEAEEVEPLCWPGSERRGKSERLTVVAGNAVHIDTGQEHGNKSLCQEPD